MPHAGPAADPTSGPSASAEPPSAADRARQRRISIALFLAGFACFSLIYCTQPLLPAFAAEFALSPAESSLALSLTTGSLAVAIVVAGALSERVGRRGLMVVCLWLAALSNLAAALAPSWPLMLAARAAVGLVLGGVPAVAMAYLAEEVPRHRLGRVMGLYVGGTAFGGMVGRVALGALAEAMSWRAALGTIAVINVAVALAFVILLPPSRNFVRRRSETLADARAAWGAHLRNGDLLTLFLVGLAAMGAFVAVYNYATFRLAAPPYSLDQRQIGLIFLAYIGGIVASPTAGALADRFGRAPVMIAGAAVVLVGLALTLAAPLAAVVAGIVLITFGFFAVHAVASGWVGRLATVHKGHAAALYLLFYYVGSSVLGTAGGLAWVEAGWPGVAAYSAVLIGAVIALTLRLRGRDVPAPGRAA